MKNLFHSLAIFVLATLVCVSVARAESLAPDVKAKFLNGELRLRQSLFPRVSVGAHRELKQMMDNAQWEPLVAKIIEDHQFPYDLYYYFLGRAAEGMGAKTAAGAYYQMALNVTLTCTAYLLGDACVAISVKREADVRLSKLQEIDEGKVTLWNPGEGPSVTEVIKAKPIDISELTVSRQVKSIEKDKFETDEEFQARKQRSMETNESGAFLIFKLRTDQPDRCLSSYDHQNGIYRFENCVLFSKQRPFIERKTNGESFTLANMIDKREIQRILESTYFLDATFNLKAEFKLGRKEASELDKSLAVGVFFRSFSIKSRCAMCESRDLKESASRFMESLSALQNKRGTDFSDVDWKKEAFKKGFITEDWVHTVAPSEIQYVLVFNTLDNKVLYQYSSKNN